MENESQAAKVSAFNTELDWQPIETAPRDGTIVDLWHKDGFRSVDLWWEQDGECWSDVNDDNAFSHWILPPNPPRFVMSIEVW